MSVRGEPLFNGLELINRVGQKHKTGGFVVRIEPDSRLDGLFHHVLSIGEGLRNREIATKLGISAATVAAHVRNIFRKLRVKTRTECARYMLTFVGAGDAEASASGTG